MTGEKSATYRPLGMVEGVWVHLGSSPIKHCLSSMGMGAAGGVGAAQGMGKPALAWAGSLSPPTPGS